MKQKTKLSASMTEMRIKSIISYYDSQSETKGAHEIETALEDSEQVKRLIARHKHRTG